MTIDDGQLDHLRGLLDRPELATGRYEILGPIARGGMGTVYHAVDRELDREVAIKCLQTALDGDGFAARLTQEARVLARLEHPGMVPVHDVGQLTDGRPYYVMRLVRGARLDHYLESNRELSRADRLRLFLKVAEPVRFAHAQGVIHRDLKPANIMVGPFGEVLVLDWGVAKVIASVPAPLVPGDAGARIGTIGYMAPEQTDPAAVVDQRGDVYSLGVLLDEITNPAPGPIPRALPDIVRRATAPVADRYRDADALAAEVLRLLDGERVLAHRERLWERAARLAGKHRTAVALVVAYLVMRLLLLAIH